MTLESGHFERRTRNYTNIVACIRMRVYYTYSITTISLSLLEMRIIIVIMIMIHFHMVYLHDFVIQFDKCVLQFSGGSRGA